MRIMSNRKAYFSCMTCNIKLTNLLEELVDLTKLSEEDGQDHLPQGNYLVAPDPYEIGGYYTHATGQYLINNNDLINTKRHHDPGRLNGCCGLDGCDGKNIVCINGHEIGTERSDCWLAHSTSLDSESVKIIT